MTQERWNSEESSLSIQKWDLSRKVPLLQYGSPARMDLGTRRNSYRGNDREITFHVFGKVYLYRIGYSVILQVRGGPVNQIE